MQQRVSQIVINTDGSRTSIDMRSPSPVQETKAQRRGSELATQLSRWGRRRFVIYAVLLLLVAASIAITGVFRGYLGALILPLALSSFLGAASLILALIAKPAARAHEPSSTDQIRATRIAALLSTEKHPLTVEQIEKKLGWTEEAVVHGLNALLQNGRVTEDLDLDEGHWHYQLSDAELEAAVIPRSALAIDDRLEAVSRDEFESVHKT